MRKKLSKLAITASLVLAMVLTLSLVACGDGDIPNGKYVKRGSEQYWEFYGNKATYYIKESSIYYKGTYKIDKDGLFLFITEDGKINKLMFAQKGKQLLLGRTQYIKQ